MREIGPIAEWDGPSGTRGEAHLAGHVTVLALGELAPLESLADSFGAAGRVLQAAEATGLSGVVDRERLGWRAAVTESPETTDLLVARHLDPLREAGDFAEPILEALQA